MSLSGSPTTRSITAWNAQSGPVPGLAPSTFTLVVTADGEVVATIDPSAINEDAKGEYFVAITGVENTGSAMTLRGSCSVAGVEVIPVKWDNFPASGLVVPAVQVIPTPLTITRTWTANGAFTDVDVVNGQYQVFLQSSDGTYGIKQKDSGVLVVASGTSYNRMGVGMYNYIFNALPGVVYQVSTMIVWKGVPKYFVTYSSVSSQDLPVNGAYHSRSDIESIFGPDNVLIWATLGQSDNAATVAARIQTIINFTEAYVNARLRVSRYIIPLAPPTPLEIVEICAYISGSKLYEPRSTEDFSAEGTSPMKTFVMQKRKQADMILRDILAGKMVLESDLDPTVGSTPFFVKTDNMRMRQIRTNELRLDTLANLILTSDGVQCASFSDT